ncbi:MAG: hypothetical protein A2514_06465 [Gammaproteobacteria bacterium RIFOXYD12_FULL_61_37]|nr:MAG: hypothetical protein A2514_06465 [Gammaproteobacteria bacterium RIFOXYD12_FULL_61_37]
MWYFQVECGRHKQRRRLKSLAEAKAMPFIQLLFQSKLLATYDLGDEELTIGRSSNNDILIDNPGVSSAHAVICKVEEGYVLEDLGSKNGSYFKGRKIQRHRLEYGDLITIFKHQLCFVPTAGIWTGVETESPTADRGLISQNQTLKIDLPQAPDEGCAWLTVSSEDGSSQRFELGEEEYCIGKGGDCRIRARGWMGPPVSAWLSRQGTGYLLTPARKSEVRLNNLPLEMPALLENGDRIEVRKLFILYRANAPQKG